MKDDEAIIKGLALCAESKNNIEKCVSCPLFGDFSDCKDRLIVGANDLVRRLTARTERLKKKNRVLKENGNGI